MAAEYSARDSRDRDTEGNTTDRDSSVPATDRKPSKLHQHRQGLFPEMNNNRKGNSNKSKAHGGASVGLSGHVTSASSSSPSTFLISVTGRIESARIFGVDDVYCKYNLAFGNDWTISSGLEEGISQITLKDDEGNFVWNFPLEVTFKSSNPHGWPQLVVSVYGSDFLGNHVARGYGSIHLPVAQGSFTKKIPLFVPESSSFLQKISAWLMGRQPEFVDPKLLAQSDGRQVVRVQSNGHVVAKFEVVIKDFKKLGFVTSSNIICESYPDSD